MGKLHTQKRRQCDHGYRDQRNTTIGQGTKPDSRAGRAKNNGKSCFTKNYQRTTPKTTGKYLHDCNVCKYKT